MKKMRDEHGVWIYGEEKLGHLMCSFFQEIISSSQTQNVDKACAAIQHKVSNEGKAWLNDRFTAPEVKQALFMMHPNKAPGPDGFSPGFFQRYWHVVGEDVTNSVLAVLNEGADPTEVNKTFICLIPKVKEPEHPKDLRPISLCNVVMRIVTKCIANRMKPILEEVVGEQQSAFLPGR